MIKLTLEIDQKNEKMIKINQQIEELLTLREELIKNIPFGTEWIDSTLVEKHPLPLLVSTHYRNRGQVKFDLDALPTEVVEEFNFDIEVADLGEDFDLTDLA